MDWQPILSGVGIGTSRPCAVTGTAAPATQWYRGGLPMNAHCVAALTTPPLGDSRRAAEAGPRQLSQQVVRHPPPVLSELGCPALCFMDNYYYP